MLNGILRGCFYIPSMLIYDPFPRDPSSALLIQDFLNKIENI